MFPNQIPSSNSIPQSFLCPISLQMMEDPYMDENGHTFEKKAIEEWYKKQNRSPITNQPLKSYSLSPNRALKDAIEEYKNNQNSRIDDMDIDMKQHHDDGDEDENGDEDREKIKVDEQLSFTLMPSVRWLNGTYEVLLNTNMQNLNPHNLSRFPIDLCCCIDTSGSMERFVSTKTCENSGLTQLDLVKHAIKTILTILTEHDRFSIVTFNQSSLVLLPLCYMTPENKILALDRLSSLNASGSTNLWSGLKSSLDLFPNVTPNRISTVFVLTDGEPTDDPPMGYIPSLEKWKRQHSYCASVHTFGFGYEGVDSKLLLDIATFANGMFTFIPDASFVGTVFINATCNVLTTLIQNLNVSLKIEDDGNNGNNGNGGDEQHFRLDNVGFLTQGQERSLLYKNIPFKNVTSIVVNNVHFPNIPTQLLEDDEKDDEKVNCIVHINLRQEVEQLVNMLSDVPVTLYSLPQHLAQINECKERISKLVMKSDLAKKLLHDINGQVMEAFSRPDWFRKWGKHYLKSFARAHLLEYCNNFKDESVQHYGGNLFKILRDRMDTLFIQLPPPVPLRPQYEAVSSMASFHNSNDVCIEGNCKVLMADESKKSVKDIQIGDLVQTHLGIPARVLFVVRTVTKRTMLVKLDRLLITPWHPVLYHGKWTFPHKIFDPIEQDCDGVYSFVLNDVHSMVVEGIPCVTLGHGSQDPTLKHDYFGTEKVIRDLSRMESVSGVINVRYDQVHRDPKTNEICGIW